MRDPYEDGKRRAEWLEKRKGKACVKVDLSREGVVSSDVALAMMQEVGPSAGEIIQVGAGVFTFCFDEEQMNDIVSDILTNRGFVEATLKSHDVLINAIRKKFHIP